MNNMGNYPIIILSLVLLCSCSEQQVATKDKVESKAISSERTEGFSETRNAYFGDVHIHTSWSFDAFIYNVRTSPDDAYNFGKGEAIPHVSGSPVQLKRPLDFMAVSDHAEYMGVMLQMNDKNNPLSKLEIAKKINSSDSKISRRAFGEIGNGIATNQPLKELIEEKDLQSTWEKMVAAADRHYAPGKFTTFPAYEWSSSIGIADAKPPYAQNMHRNVIFKNSNVCKVPFSSFNSQDPEELWKWMELQRESGIELIAVPHNGNISDGKMYALETANGKALDLEYVRTRMRNEPINEVVQIKGQSMAHPALAPNDEFAEFEIYQHTLGRGDPRKQSEPKGSFVRDAFKNGLSIERKIGGNPFQFGVIGSTDAHNGASNFEEDNNVGKSGLQDPTAKKRMSDSPASARNRQNSVGGLAGVWARENTRDAIFESFQSKEVFATSGTRIKLRLFGGWDLDDIDFEKEDWIREAYEGGIPMGGNLNTIYQNDNEAPSFAIWAIKDVEGANLDRVQVIKGWTDDSGATHEKIYDVAWSDDRKKDTNGKLASVGNTVDVTNATYTNDIGAVQLKAVWKDPMFDADQSAFYYLRVLEIPTPRWTTFDAVAIGVDLPTEVPPTIQERAWSSPIWYNPK